MFTCCFCLNVHVHIVALGNSMSANGMDECMWFFRNTAFLTKIWLNHILNKAFETELSSFDISCVLDMVHSFWQTETNSVHNSYAPPCKSLYLPTQSAVIGPHKKNHVCLLISCVSLDSNNERRAKKKSSSAMEQLTRTKNEQKPLHHWQNSMQCNAMPSNNNNVHHERERGKTTQKHLKTI